MRKTTSKPLTNFVYLANAELVKTSIEDLAQYNVHGGLFWGNDPFLTIPLRISNAFPSTELKHSRFEFLFKSIQSGHNNYATRSVLKRFHVTAELPILYVLRGWSKRF